MKIDSTQYERLCSMLYDFAGGSMTKQSQEGINRTTFVTNFMKALSDIEITDETTESINTLMNMILSYDVSIFDLYDYCGLHEVDIPKIVTFFANYTTAFNNRRRALLEKIYLSITSNTVAGNENTAVLDILHDLTSIYTINNSCRIIPKIKFSYVIPTDNSYFINDLTAANTFYTTESIRNKINTSISIKNTGLKSFYNKVKTSYENKECLLYKFSQRSDNTEMLLFVNNFRTNYSGAKNIFLHNVYSTDKDELLRSLCEDIYKLYMDDIIRFENRNKVFKPSEYYSKLTILDYKDLTPSNYKYEFFKAMILSGKSTTITDYTSEIKKLQTYLKNIYTTAVNDSRFTIGE